MTSPALTITDIHKSFATNHVLKGISLTANNHDVISILGSSGSGKSTFLRCINFLETPNSGSITIGNETVETRLDKRGNLMFSNEKQIIRLRRNLGMVFQNFNLWTHRTIIENIMEGPIHVLKQNKPDAYEKAMFYLDKVGLAEKESFYPNELSGGQQQRAAIARALCMEPDVLLFDEPTSALDPELVGEVLQIMRNLAKEGRTMIVVTHEMGFAREVSTEVVFLHEGRVEEKGRPESVFVLAKSPRFKQFLSSII